MVKDLALKAFITNQSAYASRFSSTQDTYMRRLGLLLLDALGSKASSTMALRCTAVSNFSQGGDLFGHWDNNIHDCVATCNDTPSCNFLSHQADNDDGP